MSLSTQNEVLLHLLVKSKFAPIEEFTPPNLALRMLCEGLLVLNKLNNQFQLSNHGYQLGEDIYHGNEVTIETP